MRMFCALLGLSLAIGTGFAQTAPKAKTPPVAPAPKKDEKKKEEPVAKMEGQIVDRGARGSLGVQVKNGVFVVNFYDAKKKAIAPDVPQVAVRWEPKNKSIAERTLLTPGGGANSMTSSKIVQPPLMFRMYLTMLAEGGEATGETYVFDFRQ